MSTREEDTIKAYMILNQVSKDEAIVQLENIRLQEEANIERVMYIYSLSREEAINFINRPLNVIGKFGNLSIICLVVYTLYLIGSSVGEIRGEYHFIGSVAVGCIIVTIVGWIVAFVKWL